MKVIIVRHGKDDDRYRGGWSNLDLIPEGEAQAKQLAKHLKAHEDVYQISHILSSDLPRTITTARHIAAELDVEIHTEFRLREINNGDLAGMRNDTALVQYPGLFFNTLDMDEPYPNGESPWEFYMRIKGWFEEFCMNNCHRDDNVLIVTHGGVINIVYHLVKGIEWSNKKPAFKASCCSMHILNLDTMQFEAENKTDFLSAAIAQPQI